MPLRKLKQLKNIKPFKSISTKLANHPKNKSQLSSQLKKAHSNQIISKDALNMLEGVLKVGKKKVEDIMVPRSQMKVIEKKLSYEQVLKYVVESEHSRFPVVDQDKDNIIGILHAKDLLGLLTLPHNKQLEKFEKVFCKENLRAAIFVPESKQLDTLLKQFKKSHKHLAIVVDEYGGISGLVTLEDVIEEIVGEIEDEFDIQEEQYIQQVSKNIFKINALTPIPDFNNKFKTSFENNNIDTIGGLITKHSGSVPKINQEIIINNLHFTISEADERHILNIKLKIKS